MEKKTITAIVIATQNKLEDNYLDRIMKTGQKIKLTKGKLGFEYHHKGDIVYLVHESLIKIEE